MAAKVGVIMVVLGIVLGLISNIVSVWILTVAGRRTLTLVTLAIASFLWLSMGIAGFFQGTVIVWYTAVVMMVVIDVCGVGVWSASYTLSTEASSLHLRAMTQGVGWVIGTLATCVFGIALPYLFNPDEGNIRGKTGFVFAGFTALAFAISWSIVPEMNCRPAAEIGGTFEFDLPTRKFKG